MLKMDLSILNQLQFAINLDVYKRQLLALQNKYGNDVKLDPLNDELELKAKSVIKDRLKVDK